MMAKERGKEGVTYGKTAAHLHRGQLTDSGRARRELKVRRSIRTDPHSASKRCQGAGIHETRRNPVRSGDTLYGNSFFPIGELFQTPTRRRQP